ncbi:S24 family peptidase [uncultured Sphingomonas sp.]|uniref:S24 family peptidase n=1 Tax=uncultured Sphingomonas sp. TaxID=158754 RepID=UPI0030F86BA3
MNETPQQALAAAARGRGVALSALSRMLGRNQAYLGQFVNRGSPRVLPERERRMLADFLAIDEALLGAPPPVSEDVAVPWLAVQAAAGAGQIPDEQVLRRERLPRAALRGAGVAPEAASVIAVTGDSMAPTLKDGDRLLVDARARRVASGGGIYVVRRGEAVVVKRLVPAAGAIEIRSDNPLWPVERVLPDEIAVIGRATLLLRRL